MRIGIITDAHANLPALQAVLTVFREQRCDLIVHTGDAVGIGPHPQEVVETLQALPKAVLLMGNHDEYATQGESHPYTAAMDPMERDHHTWVRSQLPERLVTDMARWPHTHQIDIEPVSLFFCHYARTSAGDDFAPILRNAAPSEFDRLFGRTAPAIVFHGHEHPPATVRGESLFIDPGALGVWNFPMAHYAILTLIPGKEPDLRLESTPFDGASVLRDLEERRVPARDMILRSFYGITA